MTTPEDLRQYVGGSQSDIDFLTDCNEQATLLVSEYVSGTNVPEAILDNAILQTGSELYHRRSAPAGIAQFASYDGQPPVRVSLDPMKSTYALLQKWVVAGV
jgi:hypothetical protein